MTHAAMAPAPASGPVVRVEDVLWARLPAAVWGRAPTLGLVLTDGGWTRAVTGAGIAAPVLAFLFGLGRGAWRPQEQLTYSYSLLWLCLMLGIALAGTGIATWLWAGFVIGDAIGHDHVRSYSSISPVEGVTGVAVPLLLSYLLLAVLLIGTPLLALMMRGGVSGVLRRVEPAVREPIAAGCAAVVTAINAGLWTQSFPLLIRPLWVWNPTFGSPNMTGIAPVQTHPWIFAAVAAAATLAWGIVAERAIRTRIAGRRYQPIEPRPTGRTRASATSIAGILLRGALILLLLGGLVPGWTEAVIGYIILTGAFAAQAFLLPRTAAARWWSARAPVIVRIAAAAAVGWLVAWQIGRTAYQSVLGSSFITAQTFAPLMYASVVAIAVMALLLPAASPDRPEQLPPDPPRLGPPTPDPAEPHPPGYPPIGYPPSPPGPRSMLAVGLILGGSGLFGSPGLLADNCGSLSDCLPSAKGLLTALAAVLIIAGLAALLFGTGGLAAGPLAALFAGGSGELALVGGMTASAGAISVAAAQQLIAAGVISTAGGIAILQMAGNAGQGSGSGSGSGSVNDIPQRPPAPRPGVRNWKLNRIVDSLWRGTKGPDRIGDGTTMDAIRNETLTGRPTGGVWHQLKGRESINALNNWLKEFGPTATRADRLEARRLIAELERALRWTP